PNFLDLCYNSDKASEVTLQPINRFNLDSAILFSDILVLPHALGWNVSFEKGEGPILEKFTSSNDLRKIQDNFSNNINEVFETITKVKAKINKNLTIIGFAGSPWTVVSYMLEGKGKQDFAVSKSFLYSNYELTTQLIYIITEKTIEYLSKQIEAGADIIQLFDSWSGCLHGDLYKDFVILPTKRIVSFLKDKFPNVPIIGFPRGSGFYYDNYIEQTGIDAVSVDQFTPLSQMKLWSKKLVVQGNLDPVILLTEKTIIKKHVDQIVELIGKENFIFNLGHGILPNTPVENVEYLVNYVKSF
nr:uroporphyrinogen decarboxylase [Chitinophagaceae bacterium]